MSPVHRLVPVLLVLCSATPGLSADPLIQPGDRVALVGGTLVESVQGDGVCEVTVLLEQPDWRVQFRNLGWSGDDVYGEARRVFGEPADGYARLLQDIQVADPNVAIIGYGFAEASDGVEQAARYEPGLRKLAEDLRSRDIRVILLQPFRLPGVKIDGYPEAMEVVRQATAKVADEFQYPLVDAAEVIAEAGDAAFDEAGLRLSEAGQRRMGRFVALQILGLPWSEASERSPLAVRLSEMVAEKNALFFHRYRPMNETYLWLFRKHEQGNNAVEIPQFDPLVEEAEREIWELAARGEP